MFPVKREIFPGRFKIPKVSQEVKTLEIFFEILAPIRKFKGEN